MAHVKPNAPRYYRRELSLTESGELRMAMPGELVAAKAQFMAPSPDEVRAMLQELRERLGAPRAYLTGLLGVPKATLRRWENGTRKPSGAARRLIWLKRCALFEPGRIANTEQIMTWGR